MYKTFEEAKAAAMNVINKKYDGFNNGCVVTESKKSIRSRTVSYGFHFNDTDTNGKFVELEDGTVQRRTEI
jgi:hypothetical protein